MIVQKNLIVFPWMLEKGKEYLLKERDPVLFKAGARFMFGYTEPKKGPYTLVERDDPTDFYSGAWWAKDESGNKVYINFKPITGPELLWLE